MVGDNRYTCAVCGEEFVHPFLRGLHVTEKHRGNKNGHGHPCGICGIFLSSCQMRAAHMRRVHKGGMNMWEHARIECINWLGDQIDKNEESIAKILNGNTSKK